MKSGAIEKRSYFTIFNLLKTIRGYRCRHGPLKRFLSCQVAVWVET